MKKSFFLANSMLTSSIVLLLIGIMAIIIGENFFSYLLKIAGGIIALSGVALMIVRFAKKNSDSKFEKVVMFSMIVCAILCGGLIYYFAEELTNIFAIILGAIILLGAIMMIIINLTYHTKESKVSRVYLISSIVVLVACAILGVVFIKNPEMGNKIMAIILGILMILLGVLFLFESFKVRKAIKKHNALIVEAIRNNVENENIEEAEIIEETPER